MALSDLASEAGQGLWAGARMPHALSLSYPNILWEQGPPMARSSLVVSGGDRHGHFPSWNKTVHTKTPWEEASSLGLNSFCAACLPPCWQLACMPCMLACSLLPHNMWQAGIFKTPPTTTLCHPYVTPSLCFYL